MKFFTTPAQKRIVRMYWENHKAFSLESLLKEKVVRCPRLARFCLFRMEGKGQIIPLGIKGFTVQYIGTTSTEGEWEKIRSEKRLSPHVIAEDVGLRGLNIFEREQEANMMTEIVEAKRAEIRARMEKEVKNSGKVKGPLA